MIRFEGIQRHFADVSALDGLDLEIEKGELVALLGPSGCGKTTALRILGGFDRPDAGRLFVNDVDVTTVPAHKRDMGMVFQAYSLFPNMDVRTNVAFGLRMRGQDKTKRLLRADELLALVGLAETADRYPHQLSGGQQQRVAIARALAIEPEVLLLDEPLAALDARVRIQLRAEIRSLQQRLGITTLFVTHDQAEALSIADRVGVMNSGRLEQIDTPENVYRHPATEFVAEFVGAMNRLPGRIGENGDVQVLGSRLAVLNPDGHVAGTAVDALLRPEAVAVVLDAAGAGEITDRTFLGSVTRLEVTLDGGQKVMVDSPGHDIGALLGQRVGLRILAESGHRRCHDRLSSGCALRDGFELLRKRLALTGPNRTRRLDGEMLLLLLLLIAWPAIEILVLIEVGASIGWLLAVVILLGTSLLGGQLLRIQGRAAIQRVSVAVSERRAPGRAAIDGLLGFLGAVLLVIPGFVTDALGALLLLPPSRSLTRRWLSRHYAGRTMRFVASTGRFASRDRGRRPDDIDSTAVDDDRPELGH